MRTRVAAAAVFSLLLLTGRSSYADPVAVGDLIRFVGSSGSLGGGAFSIDDTANGAGIDCLTFCVQMSQHVDYTNLFRVGSITGAADDAGGADPIEPETAWIFSRFRNGALPGYSPNEIQAAFWILENEWSTSVGNSAALIATAHTAVLGGWTNDGVAVLNLFYQDGRPAQDQLTYQAVPEPATLVLAGGSLAAALMRRRNRRGQEGGLLR